MKKILVYFSDFWDGFDITNNLFISILRKHYDVIVTNNNPDIVFYSCFGYSHTKFTCIKVFYTGENITPNFNVCDYACGFDHLEFGDRYYRLPLYRLYMNPEDTQHKDATFFSQQLALKTKFCNFLYSNGNKAAPARELFYSMLSMYKKVDSGGSFLNNIGYKVCDKKKWQQEYKFSIAFENSEKRGYSTEKILEALQSHTIPIYWGNPQISQDFNPKRFINCYDYTSFEAVIEKIRELDENPTHYTAMLGESWFPTSPPPLPEEDPQLSQFLCNIVEQGPVNGRRVVTTGWSHQYHVEQKMTRLAAVPLVKMQFRLEGVLRQFGLIQ